MIVRHSNELHTDDRFGRKVWPYRVPTTVIYYDIIIIAAAAAAVAPALSSDRVILIINYISYIFYRIVFKSKLVMWNNNIILNHAEHYISKVEPSLKKNRTTQNSSKLYIGIR